MDRTHGEPGTRVCTVKHGTGRRWAVKWRIDGADKSENYAKKAQAEARKVEITSQFFTHSYIDTGRSAVLFGDVLEEWFATVKIPKLKPSSRNGERSLINNTVLPRWGEVPLADITHQDVQEWLSWMVTSPDSRKPRTSNPKKRTVSKPLSASRAVKAYQVVSQVLAYAVRTQRLPYNVAEGVVKPRMAFRSKEIALSRKQVADLVEAADDFGVVLLCLTYTALRFGELAALRVGDVDVPNRSIDVSKAVSQIEGGQLIEGPTKTDKGDDDGRVVPILTTQLAEALTKHMAGRNRNEYLFPAPDGGPMRNSYARYRFDKACKKAGLEGIRLKTLRHTGGSIALSIPRTTIVTVSQLMGHRNVTTTANVYMKKLPNAFEELAKGMDEALNSENDE